MKCSACGSKVRSGKLAYVPAQHGKVRQARVCLKCVQRAVLIVPAESASKCAAHGKLATWCTECLENEKDKAKRGAADAKKLAQALMSRSKLYDKNSSDKETGEVSEYRDGLAHGLEMAANFLLRGSWS